MYIGYRYSIYWLLYHYSIYWLLYHFQYHRLASGIVSVSWGEILKYQSSNRGKRQMNAIFKNTIIAGALAMSASIAQAASASSCSGYNTAAQSCTYKPSNAVTYATTYAINGTGNTGFLDYTGVGGDCTNFVNSSIMAGLVGSTVPNTVVSNAKYFALSTLWYFKWGTPFTRGPAWTGANDFYNFAKGTRTKGMKFNFITKDSPTQALAFSSIKVGDVICADWTGDGVIDHSMLVTRIDAYTYAGIRVSYRNSTGYSPQVNRALSAFNSSQIVFHVYRPVNYIEDPQKISTFY